MDGWAWSAAVHGVTKSWTRLSSCTFTLHSLALEKDMATHSNVLAWRILWREEPGRLPSMGSHRVGHDWSDWAAAVYFIFLLSGETDLRKHTQDNIWYNLCQIIFWSFMVPCLIFKSLNHVEFIFVCDVRICSNFIDLYADVQLFQYHLLKRLFPYCTFLLCRLIVHRFVGFFLRFLLCSLFPYVCFYANIMLFGLL